ncbi:MAG: GDP-mannose 4,6-dehydratase, partial [Candidatus Anammoxibacter sp.]
MRRVALVSGIGGQDGSYLAELLVSRGYHVAGIIRRNSICENQTERLSSVIDDIELYYGDVTDAVSLNKIVKEVQPDEIYNLAAQSQVRISFEIPQFTIQTNGVGVMNMLDAFKNYAPEARFYQASSSEMFGNSIDDDGFQRETTPMHPVSPYGCAKLLGYSLVRHYHRAYGLFASNGILFNHECITGDVPIIIKNLDGLIDCIPIKEIIPNKEHKRERKLDFDVWDKKGWTKALCVTARYNGGTGKRSFQKPMYRVLCRSGFVTATEDHKFILSNKKEIECQHISVDDALLRCELPAPCGVTECSADMSKFLGLMTAEGNICNSGGRYTACFSNKDEALLDLVEVLWKRLFCGCVGKYVATTNNVTQLRLAGCTEILPWLQSQIYTKDGEKKVPKIVLNSGAAQWLAFLDGYNLGDGLKAGNGSHQFKNFKTASSTLASGLWWIASVVLDQKLTLNTEKTQWKGYNYVYYSINLGVPGGSIKGRHLLKDPDAVKRIETFDDNCWIYDIATESGTFHAGVGDIVVHNS